MISLHVKMDDHISEHLKKLISIAPDAANEALGKSGSDLRNVAMEIARAKGNANTGFTFKNGHRRLVSSDKGGSKRLFSRYGHNTGEKLDVDMADFIRFKVYDERHMVLVGFMNVKGWKPVKYRNGKRVGYWARKKGTMVKKIGELYENGGRVDLTDKQKKLFKASGWVKATRRGYVERKAHPVISQAWKGGGRERAIQRFDEEFSQIIQNLGMVA